MSKRQSQINPYEPPTVGWVPPSLAADTEFLFNDQCIAGIGRVVLPKICVVTGEAEDLVPRVSRLGWCSRWIVLPRNLLMFFSVSTAIPALVEFSSARAPGPNAFPALISPLLAMAVVIVAFVMLFLSLYVRKAVEVHWYVSQRAVRQYRRWCVVGGLLCLGGAAAVVTATQAGGLGLMVVPAAIGGIIAFVMLRGVRSLFAVGEHEGLVLIGGFSESFLKQVQQLVARYDARVLSETPSAPPAV